MTSTALTPPDWPQCGHGSTTDTPGCPGRTVDPYPSCLAHLDPAVRAEYLDSLAPGDAVDHRGTSFSEELLGRLLDAVRETDGGRPRFGAAEFSRARFTGAARFPWTVFGAQAWFAGALFEDRCWFSKARFTGDATFDEAVFHSSSTFDEAVFDANASFEDARFDGASFFDAVTFGSDAWFRRASFAGDSWFGSVGFHGDAWFGAAEFAAACAFSGARFRGDASFRRAEFRADASFQASSYDGEAWFAGAVFHRDAHFGHASFPVAPALGPVVCAGELDLSAAAFGSPLIIEAAAGTLRCAGTRWAAKASLRLRYASVELSDAVCEAPLRISARPGPFTMAGPLAGEVAETVLAGRAPRVRIESLSHVDTAHLVLTDLDLTTCRFSEAVHLDQVRLEGDCRLATPPPGIRFSGRLPLRWSARRTLAEEQHWRAARGAGGWTPAPEGSAVVTPAALTSAYRQLRKSLEDGKNEPDAADFYYGEMEMRRHDPGRPAAERALLGVYWALSGYGLRASRALGWLLLAVAATIVVMTLWGLPEDTPEPVGSGTVSGTRLSWETHTPDPVDPDGPLAGRLTGERLDKSVRTVVNSVVFRSSGQDLTTLGTYTEMGARLVEPLLLGLAVLAVRGRVKR